MVEIKFVLLVLVLALVIAISGWVENRLSIYLFKPISKKMGVWSLKTFFKD